MKGVSVEENKLAYTTIDEYILLFSPEIQEILIRLRRVIKESAPEAHERISYRMPSFVLHGNLVYFAVCKNHIGFYPTPSGIEAFKEELSEYKFSKGAVQFPLNKPLPYDLVSKIVKFRVDENLKRTKDEKKNLL
jgi:uncharacterized protein YdhG (YjbR/CyaY superfamily)